MIDLTLALRDSVVERSEVDLRLAAAGDALQQHPRPIRAVDRRGDRIGRHLLLPDELHRLALHELEVAQRVTAVEHLLDAHDGERL